MWQQVITLLFNCYNEVKEDIGPSIYKDSVLVLLRVVLYPICDISKALKVISSGLHNGGGDGWRGCSAEALASSNQLSQTLQHLTAQPHVFRLEWQWLRRSTSSLKHLTAHG